MARGRREAVMDPHFLEDLEYWTRTDRRRALRALRLVEAVLRDPFDGPGKPEPLRGQLAGKWSRRIDQEHRLVYEVEESRIYFLAARHHY
ncbi:MAG: Txe/YoeB family addiction module toxin [bacterium]|nr:Txe/YoeB family addiction module toxin [bacterium]